MSVRNLGVFWVVVILLVQTGCNVTVQPAISSAEYISDASKRPEAVALHVSEQFRSYKYEHADVGDLKNWELLLGPAATDALRFALEARFSSVRTSLGDPTFPIQDSSVALVMVPSFDSTKVSTPIAFKFENYTVTVGMSAAVFDRTGKELKRISATGKGVKRGSVGYSSAGHAALPEARP